MIDVVYLVASKGDHEDLRYSLRSLANVEHGTVWLVGHKPEWAANVEHLPTSHNGGTKWRRIRTDLARACAIDGLSEHFAYWNDDFFALRPTEYPVWHRGPITCSPPRNQTRQAKHRECVSSTGWLLQKWGIETPLNYETHTPQVMTRTGLADVAARADETDIDGLQLRSLFSNIHGLPAEHVKDCKIGKPNVGITDGQVWVSTSDGSFRTGRVGKQIRAMFPDPSPYEEVA